MSRRLQLLIKRRGSPRILTGNYTSAAGQTVGLPLTANFQVLEWTIEEGTGGQIIGSTLWLLDYGAPSAWQFRIAARGESFSVNRNITWTLAGGTELGQVTGLAVLSTTTTTAQLAFNNLPGAPGYEYSLDLDDLNPGTLAANRVVSNLSPGVDRLCHVRGASGAIKGAWSDTVIISPLSSVAGAPPATQTVPHRARDISSKGVNQFHLMLTSTDLPWRYWANSTGSQNVADIDGTGWIKAIYEPLALVGMVDFRTNPGNPLQASHQGNKIIPYINSTYGGRGYVVVPYRATDTPTAGQIVEGMFQRYPNAVQQIGGLNEYIHAVNPDQDIIDVIDQLQQIHAVVRSHPEWAAVRICPATVYGRSTAGITDVLNFNRHPQGKTWLADCAPKIDALELHTYNSGIRPTDFAVPTGANDQYGDLGPTVSLPFLMSDIRRWEPNRTLPVFQGEMGWDIQQAPSDPPRMLPTNVRAKYYQRAMLGAIRSGIHATVPFITFIEHQPVGGSDKSLVLYTIAGGVCTFQKYKAYYTILNTWTTFWDNGSDALTFTPTALDYDIGADPANPNDYDADIHHLLLQKSNGKWILLIWWNKLSWNTGTKTEQFGTRSVRLTFVTPRVLRTNDPYSYQDYTPATWTTLNGGAAVNSQVITVPDNAIAVEIT